jgi:hypothetical protein
MVDIRGVCLGTYTAIPSFFTRFKSTIEVISLNAYKYCLQVPLDVKLCFKTYSLQFHFQFRKQSEIIGTKSGEEKGWGTLSMLLVTNFVVFRDLLAGALL